MQKVIDYTDVVKNSDYGYMADFGDIFLPDYKNNKESVLLSKLPTIARTIPPSDVPTGLIC